MKPIGYSNKEVNNIKYAINHGGQIYIIRRPDDLYLMYNDFVSINDEHKNLSKKLKHRIENIREHYRIIYENIVSDYYYIGSFEREAMKILKERNILSEYEEIN